MHGIPATNHSNTCLPSHLQINVSTPSIHPQFTSPDFRIRGTSLGPGFTCVDHSVPSKRLGEHFHPHTRTTPNSPATPIPETTDTPELPSTQLRLHPPVSASLWCSRNMCAAQSLSLPPPCWLQHPTTHAVDVECLQVPLSPFTPLLAVDPIHRRLAVSPSSA